MKAAPGKNPETALAQEQDTAQVTFEDYRAGLTTAAVNHGTQAARRADPYGFQGALEAIRDAAQIHYTFTADDVRWPVRGNELGSAFRTLAQAGGIECMGYAVSKRPKAHGHLVRVWRAG
jgi:hypothetical protein